MLKIYIKFMQYSLVLKNSFKFMLCIIYKLFQWVRINVRNAVLC